MIKNKQTLRKKIFLASIITTIIILFYSCAKVIAPSGGDKDETPPAVVYSEPQNGATNFNKEKIIVKFDEYISLHNINQELITSPMLKENPEVKLRGKNMIINIKDTLEPEVTYNLNFYNAITDVNEGNLLKNYQFIFSTGNEIDTLFVIGHVYNAFNLEPEEGVFVMLYKNTVDSAPIKQKPYYLTKTDEEGVFSINSIHPGSYKLFALKDANRNFLFDQPSEPIAFIDTLVKPKVMLQEVFDTIQVMNPVDSTLIDSVFSAIVVVPATHELHLMLFTEDFENQYIKESMREERRCLKINFNRTLLDSLIVSPLNFDADSNWYLYEENPKRDSVKLWIRDSLIYNKDSVYLTLEYKIKDSLNNWVPEIDSINFLFVEKEIKEDRRRRRREEEDTTVVKKISDLKIAFSAKNFSDYDFNIPMTLQFNYPIASIDTQKLNLFMTVDTVEVPVDFTLKQDSRYVRKFVIQSELSAEGSYKFIADSAAFVDIYGNANDSAGVVFKIKALEKYGTIFLTMNEADYPGVLQLLDAKENVLRELSIHNADTLIDILYLKPAVYMLKYFVDKNGNGKWDTGKYLDYRQPDPVYYYQEEITVKENWDYEISWILKQ